MNRYGKCDNCSRMLGNNSKVTLIIPSVEVTDRIQEENHIRLKLSLDSIEQRAYKIYCEKCLKPEIFFENKDL
jgi:hypothetical protein